MKLDSLIHDLKNVSGILDSTLKGQVAAKTKAHDEALKRAIGYTAQIREMASELASLRHQELVSDSIFMNPLSLVWVDDDVDDFTPYIEAMRDYGIEITPVSGVAHALEHIKEYQTDGALVDLQMPGDVSGLEFIETTSGQVPSIVVSGYLGNSELQRLAIAKGAVGIIEKGNIGNPKGFAKLVLGFFAPERRFKVLEREIEVNPDGIRFKVEAVQAALDQIPDELQSQIIPLLETISEELAREQPDVKRISEAGSAVGNIAQGAAGNLAANGILHLLGSLL